MAKELRFMLLFMVLLAFSFMTVSCNSEDSSGEGESEGEGEAECSVGEYCGSKPIPGFGDNCENEVNETGFPLNTISINACSSYIPGQETPDALEFFWEWDTDGKPAMAGDVHLISESGDFGVSQEINGEWVSDCEVKFFAPVLGTYKVKVKVRDSNGIESGPSAACPHCPEWGVYSVVISKTEKLHVELLWNKGNQVDLDLFLVRERPDGTFGTTNAYSDKINIEVPTDVACTGDEDCTALNPGWVCGQDNKCEINTIGYVECETDTDCGGLGYCNPAKVGSIGYKMICTNHDRNAVNDTCYFLNTLPVWGEFLQSSQACSSYSDCIDGIHDDTLYPICDTDAGYCITSAPEDDPTLNIDDVDGYGPESISVQEPADGRYRVVARLYSDTNEMLSADNPATAYVMIYINGQLANGKELSSEFVTAGTYWKAADIDWSDGSGTVTPLCAGWTAAACDETSECSTWFGEGFTCEERSSGTGKFCTCQGSDPYADFATNPYANPYIKTDGGRLVPDDATSPASIWCDSATDMYNATDTCATLYGSK